MWAFCFFIFSGDHVKPGMGLFEIETDKSVMTADAMDAGYIAKIIVWDFLQMISADC